MKPEERAILLGGVGLVKGRIRGAGSVLVELCDELDPVLKESGYLAGAPFKCLDGIIRFGTRYEPDPECEPIDPKRSALPFAVEIEMAPLRRADREAVKKTFRSVVLDALEAIGAKYGLTTEGIEAFRKNSQAKRGDTG